MGFQKGHQYSRKGATKPKLTVAEACRLHTEAAIKCLVYYVNQRSDSAAALKAAGTLLDRGYGKALNSLDISVTHQQAIDFSGMKYHELAAVERVLLKLTKRTETIDTTATDVEPEASPADE